MTNRRELADRLEEAAQDLHPYSLGEIESPSLNCALPAYLNEAARLLREPVAGEVMAVLQPFADFAENVDEEGWTSNIHRESVSCWFGPSDFRAAAILRARYDEELKGG